MAERVIADRMSGGMNSPHQFGRALRLLADCKKRSSHRAFSNASSTRGVHSASGPSSNVR